MGTCNSRSEDETEEPKTSISPKAAVNPYIWFYLDVCRELAPKSIKEIASEAGKRWRSMTYAYSSEREPYVKIALQRKDGNVKTRNKLLKTRSERNRLKSAKDKKVKSCKKSKKKVEFK